MDGACRYGPYTNEELIGRAVKGIPRGKFVIATKWGPMLKDGKFVLDLSPAACRAACEGSLKRLGVDYIDLWILRGHGRDPNTPLEDTILAMKKLVEEGKVKYLGLSEISPADVKRAHAVHPITAIEMEWSLFTRDCEDDLVPVARELGIGFLAYSPLGRGMLTGRITSSADFEDGDFRKHGAPRFSDENLGKNLELVKKLGEIAKKKGVTAGQLALAWVQQRGDDVIPIPGTRRIKYLEENVAAVHVTLTPEDLEALEAAIPHGAVAGDRYANLKHVSYKYEEH
eukprot:jgi/Botrbrau1/11276/Bobra.0038s0044.3